MDRVETPARPLARCAVQGAAGAAGGDCCSAPKDQEAAGGGPEAFFRRRQQPGRRRRRRRSAHDGARRRRHHLLQPARERHDDHRHAQPAPAHCRQVSAHDAGIAERIRACCAVNRRRTRSSCKRWAPASFPTDTNRIRLVLFGMHNRIFGTHPLSRQHDLCCVDARPVVESLFVKALLPARRNDFDGLCVRPSICLSAVPPPP
jgi:hypothetical protein